MCSAEEKQKLSYMYNYRNTQVASARLVQYKHSESIPHPEG